MGDWYYSCDGVKDNGDLQVYNTYMLDYTYIFIDPCPYTGYITKVHVAGGTSFSFGVFQLVESVDSQRKFRLLRRPYPNFNEFGWYGQANQTDPFTFSSGWSHDYYGLITGPVYGLLQEYNDISGTYDPPPQNTPGNPPTKAILAPFLKSWNGVNYIPIEINAGEYFGFKINGGICLNIHDFEHTEELDGGYHYFDGDAVDDDIGQERWFTREHRVQGDHTGDDTVWYSGEPQIRVFVDAIFPTSSSSLSSSSSSQSISSTSYDSSSSLSSSSFSISSSSLSSSSVSSSSLSLSSESSTQGLFHDGFHFNYGTGDADWFKQGVIVHSGVDALQGGDIGDSQSTRIDLDTDLLADGQLSWYWRVSSEGCCDELKFYINGAFQEEIAGAIDWVQVSYHILSTDTVYWVYEKDSSISNGSDTGWLDTFTFVADSSSSKSSSSDSTSYSSSSVSSSSSSESGFAGFWYGASSTPTVGIEGQSNTYILKDSVNWGNAAVQVNGYCTKIQFYVSSPGEFDFATFTKNATQFTDTDWIEDVHFENGLHTFDIGGSGIPFQVVANETWLGFAGKNGGNIYYTKLPLPLPGYWVDAGSQIGDGSPSYFSEVNDAEYQVRFFIEQSYSASSSSVSSSSVSLDSYWFGISTVPINTTSSIISDGYTYIQKDSTRGVGFPVPTDGWVGKIQLYTYDATDYDFATFTQTDVGEFRDDKWIQNIPLSYNTLHTLEANVDFPAHALPVSAGISYLGFSKGSVWKDSIAPGYHVAGGDRIGSGLESFYSDISSGKLQIRWLIERSASYSSSSKSSSSVSSSSLSSSSLSSSSSSLSSSSSSSSVSSSSSSSFSITEGYWYGKNGVPTTGNSRHYSNYTIIQRNEIPYGITIPSGGYVDMIQFYLYDQTTIKFSTFVVDGGGRRDKNFISLPPITGSTPIGLITLKAGIDFNASDLPINVGEYFGFYSSPGEIYVNTTGGPGYYYDSGDQIGSNTNTVFSWNSGDLLQFRIHIVSSISSSSSSSLSFSSSSLSFSSSSSSSLLIHSISSSSVSISSSSSSFSNEFEHNGLYFNTSGDADWFKQGVIVHSGVDALQGGDIDNNETTRIDLVNPAVWKRELTFYWKVSSEPNFDELRFYINGLQEEISGEVDWVQKTYNIYAGDVVYWEYDKDVSQSDGDDTAWLDTFTLSGELSSSSVSSSSSSLSSSSDSVSSSSDSSSSESLNTVKVWGLNTLYSDYLGSAYFQSTIIDEDEPWKNWGNYPYLYVGTNDQSYDTKKKRSLIQVNLDRLDEITVDSNDISFAKLWIYGRLRAASPSTPIDLLLYKVKKPWNKGTGNGNTINIGEVTWGWESYHGISHKDLWGSVETGSTTLLSRYWSTPGLGNVTDRYKDNTDWYSDVTDDGDKWWSFDVTQDIKDFRDGIIENNGWVLIQRPEDATPPGIFVKSLNDESPYLEIGLPNYSSSSFSTQSSSSKSSSSLSSYSNLFSSSSSSKSSSFSSLSSSSSSASTAANERVRRIGSWSINRKVQKNYGVPTPLGDPDQMDIWFEPASSQFTRAVVVFLQYSTYSSYYSRNSSGIWYYDDPENEIGPHPYLYDFHGYYSPLNPCGFTPLHPVSIPNDYPNLTDGTLSWGNPGLYPDWWSGSFINQPSNTNPAERIHWWSGIAIWYENKIQEIENQSGDNFRINLEGDYGTDYPLTGGETDRDNYGPNGYIKMNFATFAGVFQPYKTDTDNLAVQDTHYPVSISGISKVGQTVKFNQNNDQTWPLHYDGSDYDPVNGTSPQSGDPGFINPDADFVGERRISGVGIITQIGTVPSNRHFQDSPVLAPEVESDLAKVADNDASESGLEGWDWQQVMYERNDPINTGNPAGRKKNFTPYTTYPFDSFPGNNFEIDRAFGNTLTFDASPVPLSSSASSISFSASSSSSSSSESFSFSLSSFSSSSSSYSRACPDPETECKVWPLTINDVDNELMVVNFPPNVCVNSGAAFLRRADYIFEQSTVSTTWNIQHDMNTYYLLVQVYDDCRNHIFPKEIYIIDENNVKIEFDTPMSGVVHFIYLERTSIYLTQDEEDIMEMGIGPNLGYWKVGNGTSVIGTSPTEWNPSVSNDLESPTASGSYWRIYETDENYFLDFIVPWGEALTIREIGIFNVNNDLMFYSKCSDLHKPETARVVLHYEILKREATTSSSSSSSSFSFSSSSLSSSSSSSESSSRSISSSSSVSSVSSSSFSTSFSSSSSISSSSESCSSSSESSTSSESSSSSSSESSSSVSSSSSSESSSSVSSSSSSSSKSTSSSSSSSSGSSLSISSSSCSSSLSISSSSSSSSSSSLSSSSISSSSSKSMSSSSISSSSGV